MNNEVLWDLNIFPIVNREKQIEKRNGMTVQNAEPGKTALCFESQSDQCVIDAKSMSQAIEMDKPGKGELCKIETRA